MNFTDFQRSLAQSGPPEGLSEPLLALWHDGRGDWHRAHEVAQAHETPANNLIHAYLHRKEGDTPNAGYWYRRAGRALPKGSLAQEWEALVREFLGNA